MLRTTAFSRPPPKSRDPALADVDPSDDPRSGGLALWALFAAIRRLQRQRGLPPIDTSRPGVMFEGRPKLRLTFWDKKQKRVRGIDIDADIVMTPRHWNSLHPEFRVRVPHRLLPPAVLCNRARAPTRSPSEDDPRR